MRYLKTYYSVNESKSGYLSLDDFIYILRDITDDYEHKFESTEEEEVEKYYDCYIYLNGFKDPQDINAFQFKFLEKIAHSDYPSDIKNMTDYYNLNIKDGFEEENNVLLENIKYLQRRLEFNKKIYQILENFEHYILPRFMEFKNFKKCTIGFESYIGSDNIELGTIRISFDIK
jgi:hypothetical protein